MSVSSKFFLEFLTPFFKGFISIFEALFSGILKMFNIINYIEIIKSYSKDLKGAKVFLIVLEIICLLMLMALLVFLIVKIIKRIIRNRKRNHEQEMLLEEVENLNYDNIKLKKENEKYLAMINGEDTSDGVEGEGEEKTESIEHENDERFYRLCRIDEQWESYQPEPTNTSITLAQICEQFRNYSASELGLYYNIDLI